MELALIAPFVAAIALAMFAAWDAASRVENLRAALKAGSKYYMNGGADDATAKSVVISAWQKPPEQRTVTITRACQCGVNPLACNVLCSDGAPPAVFAVLHGTATTAGAIIQPSISAQQVVRVR